MPPAEGVMDLGERHAPPANDDADFAALVDTLAASAEAGLLAGEHTTAHCGRPVLTLDQIAEVPDSAWGDLKPMLRERLRLAYERAPDDPWPALVERDAQGVLERFLHHITSRGHSPPSASADFWRVITSHHPDYAEAARGSLRRVLAGGDPDLLRDLVQIDASRPTVADSAAWLRTLQIALDTGDFSALP